MKTKHLLALFLERLKSGETKRAEVESHLWERIEQVADFKLVKGDQGDKGDRGEAGGRGLEGPQGREGPKGDQGPRGPAGPQGLKGEKGERGEQGPRGETGESGPRGPQGEAGAEGPRGEKGAEGKKGKAPRHRIDGNAVQFEQPNGQFGKRIPFNIQNTYYSSGRGLTWIDYATSFAVDPVLLETIAEGEVYEYNYSSGKTYYRLVGDPIDAFYTTYDSNTNTFGSVLAEKQQVI